MFHGKESETFLQTFCCSGFLDCFPHFLVPGNFLKEVDAKLVFYYRNAAPSYQSFIVTKILLIYSHKFCQFIL